MHAAVQAGVAAFALIVLAEMGDKTQILTMTFATRYDRRTVFFAVLAAEAAAMALGVFVGVLLTDHVPMDILTAGSAAAFILIGAWALLSEDGDDGEDAALGSRWVFVGILGLMFLAEMGDKTQIVAITMTAATHQPVAVFVGAVAGMALVIALGVMIGNYLATRFERKPLRRLGAALFIGIGSVMLAGIVLGWP